MKRIYLFFLISLIVSSCNNKEAIIIDGASESFPVLSYDAEIFETLSLDKSEIIITDTKEVLYWSKNFQNVRNNLGNIKTSSSFKNKKKIFTGSGKLNNTTSPIYFDEKLCSVDSDGSLYCIDTKSDKLNSILINQILIRLKLLEGVLHTLMKEFFMLMLTDK